MATAKRNLTNPRAQGPRRPVDPLERLVAMAVDIAERAGLLDEDLVHPPSATRNIEQGTKKKRRSA